MKKFISLLLCILLLITLAAPVYATDVSKIQPDSPTTVIVTGEYESLPIGTRIVRTVQGNTVIIYEVPVYAVPIDQNITNNNNTNNNTDTKEESKIDPDTGETPETAPIDMTEHTEEEYDLIDDIFKLVNEERVKAGVKELYYNFDIQQAADIRAKECATEFGHTRPNGQSCFTVVEDQDYKVVGENLIKADKIIATAEMMMKSWMDSEGHRYNILLPEFTSVTIGLYEKDNVVYASQIFMG